MIFIVQSPWSPGIRQLEGHSEPLECKRVPSYGSRRTRGRGICDYNIAKSQSPLPPDSPASPPPPIAPQLTHSLTHSLSESRCTRALCLLCVDWTLVSVEEGEVSAAALWFITPRHTCTSYLAPPSLHPFPPPSHPIYARFVFKCRRVPAVHVHKRCRR